MQGREARVRLIFGLICVYCTFLRRGPSVEIGIVRVMSAKMVVACIIEYHHE